MNGLAATGAAPISSTMRYRINVDRVGVRRLDGRCPFDGERGVFRGTALFCPRCGALLGGI